MSKRICMLCVGMMLIILMLLAGSATMAEDKATPTDLDPADFVIENGVLVQCNSDAFSVTVPDGVKVIGPNAFKGKDKLQSVVLPNSVEVISQEAFADCKKLKLIVPDPRNAFGQISGERIRAQPHFFLDELRDLRVFSFIDRAGAVDKYAALLQVRNSAP